MNAGGHRYAYLHGFASSALSYKGTELARRLARRGVILELPDLNRPSFAELTAEGALAAVGELTSGGDRWRFVGSSFGGWIAALWASRNPERVDRLLLLCPGFGLAGRWPLLLGEEAFARWRRQGRLAFEDGAGQPVEVHWGFFESVRRHPAVPEVPCPTRIVHGVRDEVVPVEGSRAYAADRDRVDLVEVDDDHGLAASVDLIERQALDFLVDRAG